MAAPTDFATPYVKSVTGSSNLVTVAVNPSVAPVGAIVSGSSDGLAIGCDSG